MPRAWLMVGAALLTLGCLGDAPSADALLGEAARVAERAMDPQDRALAMADVAAVWARTNRARYDAAVSKAADFARAARTEISRCLALRGVATRIAAAAPTISALLLGEAADLARGLQAPVHKAVALRELALTAVRMNTEDAESLLAEAEAAAGEAADPLLRVACLRDLASGIAATDGPRATALFQDALRALAGIPEGSDEAFLARAELAGAWAALDLDSGLQVIAEVEDPRLRMLALATMAEALVTIRPESALVLTERLPDGPHRAHLVAAVAAELPDELCGMASALASTALQMLERHPSDLADDVLSSAAMALAWEGADTAVATAKRVGDEDARNAALAEIARRQSRVDPTGAADLLQAIDDPRMTEPVLAEVLPQLARTAPDRAVEMARDMLSRRLRARTLAHIAAALLDAQEQE